MLHTEGQLPRMPREGISHTAVTAALIALEDELK